MNLAFSPPDVYRATDTFGLMPFRFARMPGLAGKVLITSDTGEHAFLSEAEFHALIHGSLRDDDPLLEALETRHFIYRGDPSVAVRLSAAQLRTRKSFLRGGPSLHIFVVTLRCDHACHYCQVSRHGGADGRFDMSEADAEQAVARLFEAPARELTVEFQGGEPLLAFGRIRSIVEAITARNAIERRRIAFTITSTLHHLDDEMLAFFREHGFHISTSLDGDSALHDANRPHPSGEAHRRTLLGIDRVRSAVGVSAVSALTTITQRALEHPERIVDEYARLGFKSIFLRPLSPFGFAARARRKLGYAPQAFTAFYERAFKHIVALNRSGTRMEEVYAAILLRSILTPYPTSYVDLRSPVGSGFGALVYNYDGGVFASDEGRMLHEMGDDALHLGHVSQRYDELMRSDAIRLLAASGLAEAMPGCADCAFVPYCGADPASTLAQRGEPFGHRAFSGHCQRHTALFQLLFCHLAEGDDEVKRILLGWALGKQVQEAA
ncbi:MAG: His-Xaa-Ser system radical SAM maturase HxsB [Xanthobacteraceae bacterium]|nr:His-Xaa-Ser system radical SAM maturase HxsB [Xanthobacteraceae bacterium]